MKRYIFAMLVAISAIALSSCKEDEGVEPGSDKAPVATLYQIAAPATYNKDQTVNLRIVPNNKVSEIYVYYELKTAKESYIKANSESKYIEKVVQSGTKYDAQERDVIIENLAGTYAISVVATSGSAYRMFESVFEGILWVDGGKANITAETIATGLTGEVKLERQEKRNIFRVLDLYNQLNPTLPKKGWYVKFTFDDTKKLTGFTTDGGTFIWCGAVDADGTWFGYWDPVKYGSYCKLANGPDGSLMYQIQCLILNNTTGSLYPGGQITFKMTNAIWVAK